MACWLDRAAQLQHSYIRDFLLGPGSRSGMHQIKSSLGSYLITCSDSRREAMEQRWKYQRENGP